MGVGLSVLIGMKATVLFLAFAYLSSLGFMLLSMPLLYASLVSMLVSIASHPSINLPMLLGKNRDGTFPIWSLIMFSPFLYFVRGFSALRRLKSGEAPYSEICEGHGRSVAVMCALLVALGVADDWKNAEKLIKEKRPYIRMNALHRKALDEWSKHRLSTPKKKEEVGASSVILSNASGRSPLDGIDGKGG